MIILVYRSADCAETVMTVGKNVRYGEFFQTAGSGGLDYSDIGDIVRRQSVESDFQVTVVSAGVMCGQYTVRYGVFSCSGLVKL